MRVFIRENISKWIAGVGIGLMCISLFITTKLDYVHSDNAWYAITGRALAEGNILLRDFVGSTISHYFPYSAMEGFWSLFFRNYEIVHALSMVSLTVLLGGVLFLAVQVLLWKRPSIFPILAFAALIISMSSIELAEAFTHVAPMLCTLSAACLYYSKNSSPWVKCGIVALLACWIDNYNIVYFLIPIVFENVFYSIKTKKIDPMAKWVVLGMAVYAIRYMLLKNIGLKVPGATGILERGRTLVHFNELGNSFSNVYLSLAQLFSANFWGMKLEWAIPGLYFSVAMFLAIYLQAKYSIQIYKEKSSDKNRFMIFLLLGSVFVLGTELFSKIEKTPRYLAGFFINGLIILGYWLNTKWPTGKKLGVLFVVTFLVSIIYQTTHGRYRMNPKLKERQEIAKIIRAENLNNGYAWFGNALSTNFVLNEQRIATISYKPHAPMLWLVDKKTFYRPGKFDFLIAWKDEQQDEWSEYDWNNQEIRDFFGDPKKTIEVGRARIYVYDDITDKVEKPKLDS
ncbi:MAG: hypothetical protein FWD46_04550 [Cystobacterineae bacterium]|nr:hypothetical protein [Cystobacterineae bacterium]